MARYLIRYRSAPDLLKALPSLSVESDRHHSYFSEGYPNVAVADLSEKEKYAVSNEAEIFENYQFEGFGGGSGWRAKEAQFEGVEWATQSLQDVLEQIRAPQTWQKSKGAGVTVIIVDSGVCGEALEFPTEKRSKLGLSFSHTDGPWQDDWGHGSMCAAIACGTSSSGAKYNGIAPEAFLMPARTDFTATDLFQIYDRIIALVRSGQLNGPIVLNNSYGWPQCTPPTLEKDHPFVEALMTVIEMGMVVVCAAGNNHASKVCGYDPESDGPNTIWVTNSLDEVICVGSVNRKENNTSGDHANSSRGPGQWAQRRPKPDCVAPTYGEVLWRNTYMCLPWWGTSGAAPQVAGLAALVLSKSRGGLKPEEVGEAILTGCKRLSGPKTCVGAGLIDCYATITAI